MIIVLISTGFVSAVQCPRREDIKSEIVKIEPELDCLKVEMADSCDPFYIYALNNCSTSLFYLHSKWGEIELSDPNKWDNIPSSVSMDVGDRIYQVPESQGNWTIKLFNKNDSSKNITIYGKTSSIEVKKKSILFEIFAGIVGVITWVFEKLLY